MPDSPRLPSQPPDSAAGVAALLVHDSVTSKLIRALDWSKSPLGGIREWPRSLISLIGVMLHSRHPMFLWWGPELIQFYNDAYLPSFGAGKHPAAMGQRGRDCWQEIWPIIGPQIEAVMERGEATWNEDALVPIFRNGRIEEVYWTYGYSPAFDDLGNISGTLVVCTETTSRVVGARRLDFLRRLAERLAGCSEPAQLLPALHDAVQSAPLDIPFFATHTPGEAPPEASWDLTAAEQVVQLSTARPTDTWPEPVTQAVAIRCASQARHLLFGVSPRLPLDANYRDFFRQIVDEVEQAFTRIEAFRARAVAEADRRNLIMQAPIATAIVTGPRHVYELANPLYREMVGGREVVGKAYVEAFPEVAGTELERIMDRVYQTGEPYLAEEYVIPLDRNGDGSLVDVYFRFNLEPIRDARGNVYGIMALGLDITQEVMARRTVEKSAAEREKLLLQLEAAGHAKDEFLATVSHELRTPLTSILGWARLLNDGADPARLQKGLAAIERNAKAQAKLIEDILDVSRIVSGKVRLNMRRVDPAAAVNAAIETVRPLASAKNLRLVVELQPDLPHINADEDRLQQVVWNLLSNAVKFTPENGQITVQAQRDDEAVAIAVKDTGKGISATFLPLVFDRFRQDDTSTTKQQAGLGLGLAIVRHLVELHGGSVSAASDGPGKGSSFAVVLPIRASTPHQPPDATLPKELVSSSGVAKSLRLRGVHTLVVDDQDDARDLLATVLEDAGATVTQARTVQAALLALSKTDVHVVISDIGMPDEDGYSFMRRLRSGSGEGRQIPAVAVTAFARAEDRVRAFRAGFQEHISKPIDPNELIDLVVKLVER